MTLISVYVTKVIVSYIQKTELIFICYSLAWLKWQFVFQANNIILRYFRKRLAMAATFSISGLNYINIRVKAVQLFTWAMTCPSRSGVSDCKLESDSKKMKWLTRLTIGWKKIIWKIVRIPVKLKIIKRCRVTFFTVIRNQHLKNIYGKVKLCGIVNKVYLIFLECSMAW